MYEISRFGKGREGKGQTLRENERKGKGKGWEEKGREVKEERE